MTAVEDGGWLTLMPLTEMTWRKSYDKKKTSRPPTRATHGHTKRTPNSSRSLGRVRGPEHACEGTGNSPRCRSLPTPRGAPASQVSADPGAAIPSSSYSSSDRAQQQWPGAEAQRQQTSSRASQQLPVYDGSRSSIGSAAICRPRVLAVEGWGAGARIRPLAVVRI
jgi:hypothetical protein